MPEPKVFLDTNGWIVLLNSSDALHEAAVAVWSELVQSGATIVLTDGAAPASATSNMKARRGGAFMGKRAQRGATLRAGSRTWWGWSRTN